MIVGVVAAVAPEPPGSYTGWGEDLTGMFITVVPLVAVGTFTLTQKTIASLGMIPSIAVYLAAFLAGLPAFGRRWPVPPDG